MAFRQNKRDGKDKWSLWLKQNADGIEASGLPSAIFGDEDRWFEFLEYGCLLDDPTEFNAGQLSLRQKAATLRLIWQTPIYLQAYLQTGVVRKLIFDLIESTDCAA